MKLDIKKNKHIYNNNTQAYHSRCSSWKLSSKARIFIHPVEKESKKHQKWTKNSVSSAVKENKFQDAV